MKNSAPAISLLCRCGADPDIQSRGGSTPLHEAAKAGRAENIEELLAKGAKIYKIDTSGQSPLHIAAAYDLTGNVFADRAQKIRMVTSVQGDHPTTKIILNNTSNTEVHLIYLA